MNSKQSLFCEMDAHLLQDKSPSHYFNRISENPLFQEYPFQMLDRLKQTNQSPLHHPEGNVWNHTMLVIDAAADVKERSKNSKALMWAALLHDIGKPGTTKLRKGKITSYDHDKLGAEMAENFLAGFMEDPDLIKAVVSLIRWHMQILFVVNDLPFGNIKAMKQQADIGEVALLGLCDRMGRLGADKDQEENNIRVFLQKCKFADTTP